MFANEVSSLVFVVSADPLSRAPLNHVIAWPRSTVVAAVVLARTRSAENHDMKFASPREESEAPMLLRALSGRGLASVGPTPGSGQDRMIPHSCKAFGHIPRRSQVWLFMVHLVVYSQNGMGLGMLLFVAQFLDFISNTMATLVLIALVHGVYITRPLVPPGSVERTQLTNVVGGFSATYLLSTLACGFKVDAVLSPFGVLTGVASWPYLVARVGTGLFAFNRGIKLANEAEAPGETRGVRPSAGGGGGRSR